MLPNNAFLRHLPAALDVTERVRLEALVFAADVLTVAFSSIREITARLGRDVKPEARVSLFAHVWSAVDQLHVIRQLIRSRKMGPQTQSFYERSESATLMRNKMDHIASNLANLSARRGIRAPLFGVLSYFLVEDHQIVQTETGSVITSGTIITVCSGSVPEGKSLMAFPAPMNRPIHPPVSQFLFTAFDWTLDLEDMVKSLQVILNRFSERAEEEVRRQLQEESKKSGIELDQLLAQAPLSCDMVLQLGIEFVSDDPGRQTLTANPKV